jgi:peptidyl-prolyl cis-trans isomerase SurA
MPPERTPPEPGRGAKVHNPGMPRLLHLTAALLAACLLPAGGVRAAAPADPIDRILIVVNDDIITAREVDNRLAAVHKRLAAQKVNLPPDAVLRRQVMERMVIERLQLQLARQLGFTASDERLERAIHQIAEQNHKTPEALKREAEAEPGGWRAFREELRAQLLVQQLIEREVHHRVTVGDAEVESFLTNQAKRDGGAEYNLSHILIALPEAASPEAIARARQQVEQIRAELARGGDFGQLAVAHSQGQNALEGGNLGWKPAGQLPDLFANALRDLPPGAVSEVLRSPNGFHLLRLNARRGGGTTVKVTQTHARHILIKTGELVSLPEARRRAALLRERLLGGEDFAQAAHANSEDLGSASNGGDLGWLNPGQTVPEFEKAMDALQPGDTSEPVQSPFGVHLIQVLERRERDVSQERERAAARQQIQARKADERYEQWLRQLRDEAFVEYRLEEK